MKRRVFVKQSSFTALSMGYLGAVYWKGLPITGKLLSVNGQRIESRIMELARFGRDDRISHSPKEFTKAADMANGANVLLHTILSIDKS